MHSRRSFLAGSSAAGLLLAAKLSGQSATPMTRRSQLQPVTIYTASPFFAAGSVFPQMARMTLDTLGGPYPESAQTFATPYRLWSLQISSSLKTTTGVIGFQVLVNQRAQSVAFSSSVQSLGGHSTSSTTNVLQSDFIELEPDGLLIPPDCPIAIYGYTSAPMLVTDVLFATIQLFMTQER